MLKKSRAEEYLTLLTFEQLFFLGEKSVLEKQTCFCLTSETTYDFLFVPRTKAFCMHFVQPIEALLLLLLRNQFLFQGISLLKVKVPFPLGNFLPRVTELLFAAGNRSFDASVV